MSNFPVREEFVKRESITKQETVMEELTKEQIEHHLMIEKARPKCHTCKYWAYKLPTIGECRPYPPHYDGINNGKFTMVYFQDWCGKHEPML